MSYKLISSNGKNPFNQKGILKPFIMKPCFNEHCTSNKDYVIFEDSNKERHFFLIEFED